MISAYNLAIGVKQRMFPYGACIKSALDIADEFCIAYDPRFDAPETFLNIDPRVRPIEIEINFAEWDFVNVALTKARRQCIGDWCLYLEMDEVLHEKDANSLKNSIERADNEGLESVHVRYITMCQDYINPIDFNNISSREKLTRNLPEIYHKTSDYMIGYIESEIWGGKVINSYNYDDFSYYDARTNKWFNGVNSHFVEDDYISPTEDIKESIEYKALHYTHVWHYVVYNWSRKKEQELQRKTWQDRTFGRSNKMDIPLLIENLKKSIVLNKKEHESYVNNLINSGWIKVNLNHPKYVNEWIFEMGK